MAQAELEPVSDDDKQKVELEITEIVDGSHFYAQVAGDAAVTALAEKLKALCKANSAGPFEPKAGMTVCAQFTQDDEWYRAKITARTGTDYTVFFIDYGNLASMPASCLLVVSGRLLQDHPDMVRIPGLALECRLAGLQPSRIRNSKGLWDEEAVDRFKLLLQEAAAEGRLVGRIYSVTRSGAGHSKFVVALDKLALRSHGAEEREVREELQIGRASCRERV